jgi:hypothetical protein
MTRDWVVRAAAWTLVGGWFGAFTLFAFVIAPTAFQVLPSQAAAGALVSPVLAALHNYGLLAGVALAGLGVLMRRGWFVVVAPLLLAAICGFSEYWVTPEIDAVGPRSFGIDQEEEASRRFSTLHQTSRYLFGIVQFGALGLIVAYARPQRDAAPQAET